MNTRRSSIGGKEKKDDSRNINRIAVHEKVLIRISAFQMEHLVEMCCEDLDLVSDVLGIFCVQGRRRLETMERVMEHDVLGDIVFEAVR